MDGLDSRSPMARKVPGHPFFKFVQGSLHNNNNSISKDVRGCLIVVHTEQLTSANKCYILQICYDF